MQQVCDDLAAEHADLDEALAGLDEQEWDTPTPAPGWSIRHQIAHLAFFDEQARLAATDPEAFAAAVNAALADSAAFTTGHLQPGLGKTGPELLAWWRSIRVGMLGALRGLEPRARLPWYGPAMGARSFATARLMETWAHGQDVADALGLRRTPTDRLRHVAHLGVRTFAWSFQNRGLAVPERPVRVELSAPSGAVWTWNEEESANAVLGDAEDFCLVVTQRRHVADTGLQQVGPIARQWMEIAQAFAGPPGPGRRPGHFPPAE